MAEDELKVKITGDASDLGNALDRAGGQVSGFSVKIAKIGKTATIAGAAVTAAFVKTFLDFTAYETRLVDMAKVTGESFEQIEKKIKSIDPILGSSTKLMEGYYQVISAGVKDPVKALETLTVASQAAKAAHTEQSEVVKGITKMMAGYEGAIKSATEAADLLFAIEKEGQTTVAELIPVIGGLSKASFDLNIKQEAMAASMAVISKTAGSTAEAATQYQAILTGLLKPTEDMITAIEDQGYATAELAIEDKGLVEVLKDLDEYSERTGISMAKLFGRKEAMLGFSALGAEGFRVLDETIVSVGEGMGGAERAFDEWSETGAAAIDKIKSTFLNLSIMIGEKVAPMIKNVLGKVTDVITKVMEWADENEELTEKLFTWGLALGAALAVLGPIAVILPSLITGVTLLSGAFVPFLVTGAIVLGIVKLTQYLNEMNKAVYETQVRLSELTVKEIDAEIASLSEEASKLQYELSKVKELPLSHKFVSDYENAIENLNMKIGLLIEQREKLTKAEEEGIDVTEEKLKLDAEAEKLMGELAEKEKELKDAIEDKTKAAELATAQAEIESKMYALTDTAIEAQIRALYELATKWQDAGVDMDLVAEYVEKATEVIYKQNEAIDENIALVEDIAKVTKDLKDAIFALTAEPYEVVIKGITEKYEDLIERVKESTLTTKEKEDAIAELTIDMEKEIELVDKTTKAEEEAIETAKLLADATKSVEDRILELTDPMAYQIQQIDELAETWRLAGVDADLIAEAVKLLKAELEKPLDIGPWETFFNDLKDSFGTAMTNMQDGIRDFVSGVEGALTTAIKSLWNMQEINAQIKADMAEENVNYKDEMTTLQEEYNAAVIAGDDEAAQNAKDKLDEVTKKHEEAMSDMEDDMVTTGSIVKTFWESFKTAAINALIDVIVKQAISVFVAFCASLGPFGWAALAVGIGAAVAFANQIANMATGGIVDIAKFAMGGLGTDTVPAMLTPGEYVISLPMVNAIKRFKMIPSNLIDAIAGGFPTPVPAFATGGLVGNPNITSTGYGDTNINIYITGNKISDDVDIRNLATKVSDEILRKLNLKRRH